MNLKQSISSKAFSITNITTRTYYHFCCRADLPTLEVLTMCIKEGMRLHSPVPMLIRETEKEFQLGDKVFPKGTLVHINIWVMNHMEKIWGKDHWDFKPERFSKDNCAKMSAFQYIPFSAGQR